MNIIPALILVLLSSVSCVASDILSKLFDGSIEDLLFIRFALATLISFIYYRSFSFISIKNAIRGGLFALSMFFFTYGLRSLPLTLVILINFATPIWTIIFSKIFFNEKIQYRLISSIINTFGIAIALTGFLDTSENIYPIFSVLLASVMFSLIDVINKSSMNYGEKISDILIGSSFFSSLFFIPKYSFTIPSSTNMFIILGIAISALAIPYFMMLASKRTNLSALQPLKYAEFPMTIIANKIFFHEVLQKEVYYGFAIILLGIITNYFYEIKNS